MMTEKSPPTEENSVDVKITAVNSGLRNGIILALFALLSTGITAITWMMTKERIQSEKEQALLRAISELVPAEHYANDPYHDCTLVKDPTLLGSQKYQQAWRLRNSNGDAVAVLISSVAPNGYNGAIEIIVGHYVVAQPSPSTSSSEVEPTRLNRVGLAGVRVTAHNETPGLGDKISTRKGDWILQFAGTQPETMKPKDWQVKKDGGQYDAFTGATITPRAVLQAIRKNIEYFDNHQQQIFTAPANCLIDAKKDVTHD